MSYIKTIILDLNEFRDKNKDVEDYLKNLLPIKDVIKIIICDVGPMTARNIKAGLSRYRRLYPEWERTMQNFPAESIENYQNSLLEQEYIHKIIYINEVCLFEDSELKQKNLYFNGTFGYYNRNCSFIGFSYIPKEIKQNYHFESINLL